MKPGNVLLTRSGEAKVTDFGIARAMSSPDEDLTQAGSVMGTATYFSPEQAQGLSVDPRSDLYSLGVVLYELVTGRPPFAGETPLAIAYKHVQDQPPAPSTIMSDLPEALEAIIMKLLAKQPDDRYASAEDLRADLHRYLAGDPTLAERELLAAGAGVLAGAAAARAIDGPATTMQDPTTMGQYVDDPPEEDPEDEEKSKTWLFVAILVGLLAVLAALLFWFTRSLDDGQLVTVPPVVGLTVEEATQQLRDVDLEADVSREPSSEFPAGIVISQDPAKDDEVDSGSTVELVVSSGREVVVVPSVIFMTQAEATRTLEDANLTVKVTERENDDAGSGDRGRSEPAGGRRDRTGERGRDLRDRAVRDGPGPERGGHTVGAGAGASPGRRSALRERDRGVQLERGGWQRDQHRPACGHLGG